MRPWFCSFLFALLTYPSSVFVQERDVRAFGADTTYPDCHQMAREFGMQVERCNQTRYGAIAYLRGADLGTLDFLSAVTYSEITALEFSVDNAILAREIEAYLDGLRPLTLLPESPTIRIAHVGFDGFIRFHHVVHGLDIYPDHTMHVDPATGRVVQVSPAYVASAEVDPPSDRWWREADALALAADAVAAKFGAIGDIDVYEGDLHYIWKNGELRPEWTMGIRSNGHPYRVVVDALSGEAEAHDGLIR